MSRHTFPILITLILASAASVSAQPLGTFRWQMAPFGSVLNLNVTQQGSIYTLDGFEAQCGGNASLPVSGIAVPQANGQVILGLTTITTNGRGLHTEAVIATNFSGTWRDNANQTGTFVFSPGTTCPGGLRIGPIVPDVPAGSDATAALVQWLQEQVASLQKRLAQLEARKE